MNNASRAALLLPLLALAACGADAPESGERGAETPVAPVVVYSSRAEQLIEPIFTEFTKSTGIPVEYVTDDPQPLIARLQAEGDVTPASVLLTVDAGNLWFAAEQGVLQPVESELLTQTVPAYWRDTQNQWFGLSLRARTIIFDNRKLSAEDLIGYQDLADEKWQGRLCLRTSKKVYNQSLVAMMIAAVGEEQTEAVVSGWVSNLAEEPFSNDTRLIEAVADGRCEVGIVNTYYLGRLQREQSLPVSIFWQPAEFGGVHVNVSGAGIVKHAANAEGAARLLEWLATDGQTLFASKNLEYPVLRSTANDPIVEAWGDFDASEQSLVDAGRYQADAVRLMDRVGYR
ncbi:MAG: extracellular solute-binding protein [Pseudomonadota bacterium]